MNAHRMTAPAARLWLFGITVLLGFGLAAAALAGVPGKIRVKQQRGASVFPQPAIGQPITTFPLNKVLDAESKDGQWYKITFELNGVKRTGYIHEMLVDEVSEGDLAAAGPRGPGQTQDELVAEIGIKIEEIHKLVVREQDLPAQVESLYDLLPKVFGIEDVQKQHRAACDIYLLAGQALSKQDDYERAIREFKNMFTVDYPYAKNATKYESDPNIGLLIGTAEKQYNGTFVGYVVHVNTNPKDAVIKVNGKDSGRVTPDMVTSPVPRITLELEKDGYKTEKVVLSLTDPETTKTFDLQCVARMIHIGSDPGGANISLDGQDMGKLTECDLGLVSFGPHKLTVKKTGYGSWDKDVIVEEGPGPLSLTAVLPAQTYFGAFLWPGLDDKNTNLPRAMILDAEGAFYIIGDGPAKVRKFTRERSRLSWGQDDKEVKSVKEPGGIAVGPDGGVYLTDRKSSSILKIDKTGKFVRRWGKLGAKDGDLTAPSGIAVDRDSNVYVIDAGVSRVLKYSPTGQWIKSWGKQGSGPGEFFSPGAVTVNSRNEIIVVDVGRIQKFSADGILLAVFAKQGPPEAEFKKAQGVSCDAQDSIYVADPTTHRVYKFQADGRFVGTIGVQGTELGQLYGPVSAVVDSKGSVFVLETINKRIQEFQPPAK